MELKNVMHGISRVMMRGMSTESLTQYAEECDQEVLDCNNGMHAVEWNETEKRQADKELERRRK